MDHLAIMKPSWKLLEKILDGSKVIESRWYKSRSIPWNRIHSGDIVYFKNSGESVSVRAEVEKVLQFENLTSQKVRELLDKYGDRDGITPDKIELYYELFKDKNYCLLVFLKDPVSIEPFSISKKGFGAMSAWITVDDISTIRLDG